MPTLVKVLVACCLLLLAASGTVRGEVDCNARPSMNEFKDCCKIPEPKWDAYTTQCFKNLAPMQRHPNPCALSCIFNVSHALQGETINMDNARTMLTALYPGNQDFQQAYALGFETCAPIIAQKVADFKAKNQSGTALTPKMPGAAECSPLATLFAMCAHKNVFVTCPATAWAPSPGCQSAKEFATECEMGGPGRRAGSRNARRFSRGGGGGAGGGGNNRNGGSGFHLEQHRRQQQTAANQHDMLLDDWAGFY